MPLLANTHRIKRLSLVFIAVGAVAMWTALAAEPSMREELDIVYGKAGDEELKLDLYAPPSLAHPVPAIVIIHGGGWSSGSRANRIGPKTFVQQGYIAVTIDYRLAPKHRFPAQIEDVKCAVRWLRANAEKYKIDPNRIGATGGSAGGHLALMLGLMGSEDGLEGNGGYEKFSSHVQAVVAICPPSDFTQPDWPTDIKPVVVSFLGGTMEQVADNYRRASPVTYVDKSDPPVLLIHGTSDEVVPYTQSQRLIEKLKAAGLTARLETMEGKKHSWMGDIPAMIRSGKLTQDFFREQLMNSSPQQEAKQAPKQ